MLFIPAPNIHELLGFCSAIIVFASGYPYIRDIYRRHTRPNRVSWFGWLLLGGTSALIQLTHHPDSSIFFVLGDLLVVASVFFLSFRHGVTKFTLLDGICLLLGCIGIVLWLALNQPLQALIANICADLCFSIPTFIKTYRKPTSESRGSWGMAAFGMFIGLASKTDFGYFNTLFPAYMFLQNALVYTLCTGKVQKLFRRRKVRYHHR